MKEHLVKTSSIKLVSKEPLKGAKLIVIYLGDKCNFDCTYCDRDYIKNLGSQSINGKTTEELKDFFSWVDTQPNEVKIITFHGGEPLLFVKRIYQIMEWLYPLAKKNSWKISMTTNGSLIKENEMFFKKYSDVLWATVSYDFMYQKINRTEFDVKEMAQVLNDNCEQWQWQFVIPIDDPKAFSFNNIQTIVNACYSTGCRVVNIIPLRHKRGKDKFEVILDKIDLEQFLEAFLQFIQILFIKKITVFIDGCYTSIDKAYFTEHHKLILSPDGFIYPEFDFLEYKIDNAKIGNWKDKQLWKHQGDSGRILDSCRSCTKQSSCGLKYLYKLFDKYPEGNCKKFYTYVDYIIMHNAKLNQKKTLLEWVGIKQDFDIIT